MIYTCTFKLLDKMLSVESEGGIGDFKDGFWITYDERFTKGSDGGFWIPPSQILFISTNRLAEIMRGQQTRENRND